MLVAGAGFGKTTLGEQWARQEGRRAAWIRARRSSADVAVLVRQVATAAAGIVPECDLRLVERLNATGDPAEDLDVLVDLLAEDIAAWPEDAWLIVDDYQYIRLSETAEAFIEGLVQRSPVQVLISSRERPSWVSMRSVLYGEVLEIGQALLAMSEEEVNVLLAGAHEELSPGLLALAGGWPAVVSLASLTPHEQPLVSPAVDIPEQLYAFFAEEVYRRLDPESRAGLGVLATAPALDRQLAADLLGSGRAARICGEARSLGVLEEREGRLELHPLAVAFLHEQARRERSGERLQTFERCLEAYRLREEWDAAFELVERYGSDEDFKGLLEEALEFLLNTGRLATVCTLIARAASRRISSPTIEVARAELALREGKHLSAEALAHNAIAVANGDPIQTWRAAMLAGRAAHAGSREQSALEFYRLAGQIAVSDRGRREALLGQLSAASSLELEEVRTLLDALGDAAGVPDPYERIRIADKKLAADFRSGELAALAEATRVAELVDLVTDPFARCSFRSVYSYALCLGARYTEAYEQASMLCEDARRFRIEVALPYAHTTTAAALAGLGRFADAHVSLGIAISESRRCNDEHGIQNGYALHVRILAQEGRSLDALALELPDLRNAVAGVKGEVLASRGLALASAGRFDQAREAAVAAARSTKAIEVRVLVPSILAICALKQRTSNMRAAVDELMREAMDSGAVDVLVAAYRSNVELLEALLASDETREQIIHIARRAGDEAMVAAGGWHGPVALDPIEALSRREREVYGLLCDGLSNAEIARALFIAEATVKVHVQHVFDKLGIRSRTALAINAALERRLRGGQD